MQLLNPVSENLLQFLCDNTSIGERNNADIVFEAFKNRYSRNDIIAELECLSNQGYIKAMFDDSYEIGYIILHSNGISYFRDKQCRSESYSPSVIINNSTGFNVGNNNSNSININDNISFDDVYKLVDSLNSSNKEELREIVDCLKDCLENSKPLPKGKFQQTMETVGNVVSFLNAIGKILVQHLVK